MGKAGAMELLHNAMFGPPKLWDVPIFQNLPGTSCTVPPALRACLSRRLMPKLLYHDHGHVLDDHDRSQYHDRDDRGDGDCDSRYKGKAGAIGSPRSSGFT